MDHLPSLQKAIRSVCRHRRLVGDDADEFTSTVYLRFVEHDYRILRRFQGRSSIQTFLHVVVQRIYLDFRNRQWGKWRPSARATRQGPVAVLFERLLDRDGCTVAEAANLARAAYGVSISDEEAAGVATQVRIRPRRHSTDEAALGEVQDPQPLPDERLVESESARETALARRALAKALFELEPADRELISLRFQTGFSVADIARAQGLDPKPLYRRIEQLLRQLRRALEAGPEATPTERWMSRSRAHVQASAETDHRNIAGYR